MVHLTAAILAQAAPSPAGAPQGSGSFLFTMLPFLFIFLIFYFLLILPQRRRQKKHQEMLDALKPGDRVITNGGMYGTIVGLEGPKVVLRVADQVKIEFSRAAISALQEAPEK